MFKNTLEDVRLLLRNIPAPVVTVFAISVVVMNLLANKELVALPWLALDCGFLVSWVSFLCMDIICKRFGARASVEVSVLALVANLAATLVFFLASLAPGHWGAYYDTGLDAVNTGLNATFAGSWYVVLGSSLAMLVSSIVNGIVNQAIGRRVGPDGFGRFALRSYVSTLVGQVTDNLVFAIVVSHVFFGWTWAQVVMCSLTGAVAELLFEVVLGPVGYRVVRGWERDGVGAAYLAAHPDAAPGEQQVVAG